MFTLLKTMGGGGNLLFNVGPMPDGEIELRQVERLEQMGKWMKKYGELIYATTGGPYKPNNWLASTRKGNIIYIHLMNFRENELELPFFENTIVNSCRIMNGEKLRFELFNNILKVHLDAKQEMIKTLEIKIDKDADSLKPVEI